LFPTEPEVVIDKLTTFELAAEVIPKPDEIALDIDVFISVAKDAGEVIDETPTTVADVAAEAAPPEKD
jgi:hypothetical protein